MYLVVAFHAGMASWRGGFIGVDVFFVLSGFLVTRLLVRDLTAAGRVDFARFYSRRVRRLLPAAAVNLVIVAIIFAAIAAPVELPAARAGIRAAALYVSNWYFIAQAANYFGADIASSPVAHYWSLSVEEQFYVVWPLLVYGLFRLGRRIGRWPTGVVRVAVALGGLASLAAALYIGGHDVNRAYYGTDTRAYQLLAGAFLALTPEIFERTRRSWVARWLPAISVVLLGAVVVTAMSVVEVGPITRGLAVTLLMVGLIISLEASAGGIGQGVLSLDPLPYLGRISYSTYLWHWVVILVATREFSMSPLNILAVTVPVATGLAALSYELLEHPIRTSRILGLHRFTVIAAGLAVSVLVGVAIAPQLLKRAGAVTTVAASNQSALDGTPNHADWHHAFYDFPHVSGTACDPDDVERCRVVHGSGLRFLVAGESHAQALVPMLTELAKQYDLDLTLAPLPYCPWTLGVKYAGVGKNCARDQASLYDEVIPKVDPDVVILAHRTVDDPNSPLDLSQEEPRKRLATPSAKTAALRSSITAVVHRLRSEGRKVVLMEPMPVSRPADNPETCLSKAKFLESCRYVSHVDPTPEEQIYRELAAADPNVVSVDLDRQVCPYLPICDPLVNGIAVKHDDNHMTVTFSKSLLRPFERVLLNNGILH